MRMPDSLARLVDYGILEDVIRPLMSGKEAQIYLVHSEGEERVAKVYKEAQGRSFKHRAAYTEGRKTRNSRDQRAMAKRSRHGREQDEAAWRSTEVDMIYRLRDAGVRVPEPYQFVEGVLVMELVQDEAGDPAPRLGDISIEPAQAVEIYQDLIGQVVRMLCAGVVHGDLSEFNVLMGRAGPTVIDFPQAVDPAGNANARRLLLRDVENLHRFVARLAPGTRRPRYAEEMWQRYESNRLEPTTKLAGDYRPPTAKTDTREVLQLIDEAGEEEMARRSPREADGEEFDDLAPQPFRKVVDFTAERDAGGRGRKKPTSRGGRRDAGAGKGDASPAKPAASRSRRGGNVQEKSAAHPTGRRTEGRGQPAKPTNSSRTRGAAESRGDGAERGRARGRSRSGPREDPAKVQAAAPEEGAPRRSRRRRGRGRGPRVEEGADKGTEARTGRPSAQSSSPRSGPAPAKGHANSAGGKASSENGGHRPNGARGASDDRAPSRKRSRRRRRPRGGGSDGSSKPDGPNRSQP